MEMPLVTVGIPTYNRPEGLKKALFCITHQTYKNLQIIVADNCSENEDVKRVVDNYSKSDSRIIYYRHRKNEGAAYNFRFVLEKAEGKYFMWAADDDEWEPDFIEHLTSIISNRSAAFCNYSIKHLTTNEVKHVKIFQSASGDCKYKQAVSFLKERTSSMFYGIYNTNDIRWFNDFDLAFDWSDCYVIFRIILLYKGYAISDKYLYTAGMQSESYAFNPVKRSKKKLFTYGTYTKKSIQLIFKSKMALVKKIKLCAYLIDINLMAFMELEKRRSLYPIYHIIYRIYRFFIPRTKVYKLY